VGITRSGNMRDWGLNSRTPSLDIMMDDLP
jgi:hypothetical protein